MPCFWLTVYRHFTLQNQPAGEYSPHVCGHGLLIYVTKQKYSNLKCFTPKSEDIRRTENSTSEFRKCIENRHQSNVRALLVSGQNVATQPQTSLGCVRVGLNLAPDPRALFRKTSKDLPYDNCEILEVSIRGIC